MSKSKYLLLLIFFFFSTNHFCVADDAVINLEYRGNHDHHGQPLFPADQPDVYFDDDTQVIIVDGTGYSTYYNVDNEMFAYSFGNNISTESTVLGNVYYYTKENYSNSQWENLVCRHNFLGDPALDMWTNIPQQYSNITISRTDNSVSLSGITAINTIIAYYANDGQMGADTISTSSVTLNNISPNSTIMLYKHDYIPYIAPLVLQNIILSNSQYVIASDVTAGRSVDSNRTSGNVTVSDGVKYDIETSGTVRLAGGFNVEKGGHFAVRPSSF